MPNTDERRAKVIIEENANGLYAEIGKENFDKLWQEFLKTDYGKLQKPYAIAVAFGIWYLTKIERNQT